MRESDIEKMLRAILEKYVGREKVQDLWQTGQELLVTGDEWGVSAITLTYIFFDIEKTFQIKIDVNSILNYEFGTLNGMKRLIYKYTNEKEYKIAGI